MSRPPSFLPLPIAPTLDAALGLFRGSVLSCLPYGVLTTLASQLPALCNRVFGATSLLSPGWWIANIAGGLLMAAFWNAILLRQKALTDRAPHGPGARPLLQRAFSRVSALITPLLLLAGLGVLLLGPAWLLPAALRPWVLGIGGLLLLAAGAHLSNAWVLGVLEALTPWQACLRSVQLVRGQTVRVLATCLVGALMLLVLAVLVGVVVALLVPLVLGDDLALITSLTADVLVACTALAMPFMSAVLFTVCRQLQGLQAGRPLEGAPAVARALPTPE